MKKTSYILALLAAASSLLLSGCAKEGGNGADAVLSFSADTPELVEVKAAAVTSVSDFYTIGYAGTTQWFPTSGGPQSVQISGGSATFGDYKWKMGDTKTFYAYSNNLPTGATATIANSGVTLTYTAIPTEASAQTDVTLGRYSGNGSNTGTAAMTFYHPLAQVVFKMGTITNVVSVTGISIKGVYAAGSTALTTSTTPLSGNANDFVWTKSGSATVSQTTSVSTFTADASIGTPFMVIPQALGTDNVTVSMDVTLSGNVTKTVSAKLSSGAFVAGKTTAFTVSYDGGKDLKFTSSVSDWGSGDDIEANFTIGRETMPPADEIWYTTTDNEPITGTDAWKTSTYQFGVKLVSNTYSSGIGVLKFEGDIIKIDGDLFRGRDNLQSLMLPSSPDIKLMDSSLLTSSNCTIYVPDIYKAANFNADSNGVLAGFYNSSKIYTITFVTSKGTFPIGNSGGYIILGDGTMFYLQTSICFTKGTLITLADGSRKPVEEVKFGDRLKVWNFDKGCEDSADILWMMQGEMTAPYYFKCTFSDGTVFNIIGKGETGLHRMFDKTKGKFLHYSMMDPDDEIYTENGLVTLVSCEKIEEEARMYNIVTVGHINCFTNGILTSARYNNRYPIDQNMKFVKDDRKFRPYSEFREAGIRRVWYEGMRLSEVQDSIATIKLYFDSCDNRGRVDPDWKEPGFFANIWQNIKIWWHNLFV